MWSNWFQSIGVKRDRHLMEPYTKALITKTFKMENHLSANNLSWKIPIFEEQQLKTIAGIDNVSIEYMKFIKDLNLSVIREFLSKVDSADKKNFLVLRNNKYLNVLTENIALFFIKYQSASIICFDNQEYLIDYSLDQIQKLISEKQFFRLNRKCLINFRAVKDVEHSFSRKLLVNSVVSFKDTLLVSREKGKEFLNWLDNR